MTDANYDQEIQAWRSARLRKLTAEDGWTTLVGLYWLKPGENRFGRTETNDIVMAYPGVPEQIGTFEVTGHEVSFTSAADAKVFHNGRPVYTIGPMQDDAVAAPTLLNVGSVSFYLVERSGRLGIRVKDSQAKARTHFLGLDYFPVAAEWRIVARVEPYSPVKKIPIVNVLGLDEVMNSPGALVFEVSGLACRLDAVLEAGERDWFVMFADQTNGEQSYGAGRFLYVAPPVDGHTVIDFNKSYSPPCSFSAFATCPLPPPQNRLAVAVTAGELKYAGSTH